MKYLISVLGLCFLAAIPAARAVTAPPICSTIEECQAKYNELEQQAAAKRAIIATTQDQANTLKNEIAGLQNQINAVQAEISATGAKISQTELEIGSVKDQIGQKQATISTKRETIGRMVAFLDAKDHEDLVAQLFEYATLSDFVSQIHDIAVMQSELLNVINDLQDAKTARG